MRKIVPIIALLAAAGCDRSKPELEKTIVQVQQISAEKDSLLRDVVQTSQFIADVNAQLAKVKSDVGKPVKAGAGELETLSPAEQRARLLVRVKELTQRVNQSEERLQASRNRIRGIVANSKALIAQIAAHDSIITGFRTMIENQRSEIALLTTQLYELQAEHVALTSDKEQLTAERSQLVEESQSLTAERNTVFYVIGTHRELLDKKLIEQEGGTLGLGQTQVPARTLDPSLFTAIDRTKVLEIALPNPDKSYRVLTRQDVSALDPPLDRNGRVKGSLRIRDAERFWAASKYLIIVEQ